MHSKLVLPEYFLVSAGPGLNAIRIALSDISLICVLDMLLTEPIDEKATQLPSPDQLKRKIILKVNKSQAAHKIW